MQKTIDKVRNDAFRTDFMIGQEKGYGNDKITRQKPQMRLRLSQQDLSDLYATNAIVQNIIDIPAEDMTQNGWDIEIKDNVLHDQLMKKLRDLNAKQAFYKCRQYERLRGDGFIALGLTQSVTFNLADPLDPLKIKSIDYLNPFSSYKVNTFMVNQDPFSQDFGTVDYFRINRLTPLGREIMSGVQDLDNRIHASRLIHDQTRLLEEDELIGRGQPIIEPLYDVIKVLDTSLWSVGQILYDFVFKVYKSEDAADLSKSDKAELGMLLDFAFRTEALGIIGTNEDLEKKATPVTGIKDLLDYVWDYLAGAVRMPKSVIKGQQAGTIAGAQYDVMNYYARISAMQENQLRPHLEHLINLILQSEEFNHLDPEKVDYQVKFNPLWHVDSATDATIRFNLAQADQIYLQNGVLDPEEVKEARFGSSGMSNVPESASLDGLSKEEIDAMAKEVYHQYQEAHKDGKKCS
ncbi:MAG: phage portal protein [Sporolactobacillus sp.]